MDWCILVTHIAYASSASVSHSAGTSSYACGPTPIQELKIRDVGVAIKTYVRLVIVAPARAQ